MCVFSWQRHVGCVKFVYSPVVNKQTFLWVPGCSFDVSSKKKKNCIDYDFAVTFKIKYHLSNYWIGVSNKSLQDRDPGSYLR